MRLLVSFFFFSLIIQAAWGQKNQVAQASNSMEPLYPKKDYAPKKSKKKKSPVTYDAQNDFYDRMEKNWDEREKREKDLSAADKSQPPYFGHKRPPKKRPAAKMKYCKVCGIRH